MPIAMRTRVAAYALAMLGSLITGYGVAKDATNVRIELIGNDNVDLSKVRGESISLYGIYVGQTQVDAEKMLIKNGMSFVAMSKAQMAEGRMDPKYETWFIDEPTGDLFPGILIRFEGRIVEKIIISTVPSEFPNRQKDVYYRRFNVGIKSLLTNYSHEAQIKSFGTPDTSIVEAPTVADFLRRDFYPKRGICVTAYGVKRQDERYADVGIAFSRPTSSVADVCN